LIRSIRDPQLFGDDKDGVIRKLNQISAALGVGLGYYKADENPVDYSTANNPFLLLKVLVLPSPRLHIDFPCFRRLAVPGRVRWTTLAAWSR
jgi:hypothetical protein